MGNSTVTNQPQSFGIYGVFAKPPGDDVGAVINADWVSGFQEWVQAQSVTGDAPHLRGTSNAKEKNYCAKQDAVRYRRGNGHLYGAVIRTIQKEI